MSYADKITVVNKYKHEATSDDVYIGRGSVFGNSFSHLDSVYDVTKCENRDEAIQAYREWFNDAMISCGCRYGTLHQKVRELIVRAKMGQETNLVCYCSPKACHGDVIRDYVLTQLL